MNTPKLIVKWTLLLLLCGTASRAQTVQVPVPPVTPPPVPVNVKVTNIPPGCAQGSAAYGNATITIPLIGANCGGSPPPPPPPPPPGCQGAIKPTGGIDNANWLAQIAATKGATLEVCPGTYHLQPITFPSNTHFALDDGVTVNDAGTGYGAYSHMLTVNGSNVSIAAVGPLKSAGFTMPFGYASNSDNSNEDTNQYKHCVFVANGSSNVTLTGFWMTKCGGDGVSIDAANNVNLNGLVSTNNIRNGGSITGPVSNVTVTGGTYNGNVNFKNAGIADGWDVEQNSKTYAVTNLKFVGVTTNTNGQDGICLCLGQLDSTSPPISISITGHMSNSNAAVAPPPGLHGGLPYRIVGTLTGSNAVKGTISIADSTANGQSFTYSYSH